MSVEERLEEMEKEVVSMRRRSRWVFIALLLAGVGGMLLGLIGVRANIEIPDSAKVIRASQFVIVNEKNQLCGGLVMSDFGPRLAFLNDDGQLQIELEVAEEGSRLAFYDKAGEVRARLSVSDSGPMLAVADENGNLRAALGVLGGLPGFSLYDENGHYRAALGIDDAGPVLTLYDEKGNVRTKLGSAELQVIKTGETSQRAPSSLIFFDKEGKVMWKAP